MTEAEEKLVAMAMLVGFEISFYDDYYTLRLEGVCHSRGLDREYAPINVADNVWRPGCDLSIYEFLKPWLREAGKTNPTIARLYEKAKKTARTKRAKRDRQSDQPR